MNVNTSTSAIDEQRAALEGEQGQQQTQKKKFDENNYLNVRLKEGETSMTVTVRILPATPDAQTPFTVVKTHSLKVNTQIASSGYKSYVCLNDPHIGDPKGCPLCNKSKQFFDEGNAAEEFEKKGIFKQGYQWQSKRTFIVRVIDRDHEDHGVKFWRFNEHSDKTGIYDELMSIYDIRRNESIKAGLGEYNVFDLENGKDFVITLAYNPNTKKTSIKIADSGFQTPLSRDKEQALAWVNDTKTWRDMYASKSFEYLEIIADGKMPRYDKEQQKYIAIDFDKKDGGNDEENGQEGDKTTTKEEPAKEQPKVEQSVTKPVASQEKKEEDVDDLPF